MKKTNLIMLLMFVFVLRVIAPPIYDEGYEKRVKEARFLQEQIQIKKSQLEISKTLYFLSLGYSESRMNHLIVNKHGYVGIFQFGASARKATGGPIISKKDIIFDLKTKKRYLKSSDIWPKKSQYASMDSLLKINTKYLQEEIDLVENSVYLYKGKKITKSGILAAAHLAGYNNVKKFFKTKGRYNPADCNKTKLSNYLINFSHFNI